MDIKGVLERVYTKMTKENLKEIISQKREGWVPPKKNPKKKELKDDFLALEELILPEEIEDFLEMAVMAKNIGLPAYTYKVKSLNFLVEGDPNNPGIVFEEVHEHPYQEKYLISIENNEETSSEIKLTFRLKEYAEHWRRGVRNVDTLSAVYKIDVSLDKEKMVVTIFSGNHYVQEIISNFLNAILKWPLQNYKIREIPSQVYDIGNASFKTALLIDFVSNRLLTKGIISRFKEIKFNTKSKRHKNEGIKNVTINGRNILSSQLACEYITLGSDVISFKVDMTYNEADFSTLFFLKGTDLDIMKIVVAGQENNEFKQEVIDMIQEEYIGMCGTGISNMIDTKAILSQIYEKFINGDKLSNEVIQASMVKIIDAFSKNLHKLDTNDEEVLEFLEEFYKENKSILDSVGLDESETNLIIFKEVTGITDEEEELEELEDEEEFKSAELSDEDTYEITKI